MQEFYKKALLALVVVLVVDALIACFCVYQSYPSAKMIPRAGGPHWQVVGVNDATQGGTSHIRIEELPQALRFDFAITRVAAYPFVSAEMLLVDGQGRAVPADLSRYTTVSFVARCAPSNALLFSIVTFDETVSKPGDFLTYPSPLTFFSCSERGTPVSLDLTRLTIPQWWFDTLKRDLARQSYQLNQVSKLVFGVSQQSPRERDSHVEISELTLHGRDYRYLSALAIALAVTWSAFGYWFFRAHARALVASLESQMKKDLPLVAYRQLTLEPFKDKEKAAILRFIATNYTDTELDLEAVVAGTATNRNKVNEVLKRELGMTFTSYLNKLRLTEAARLLTEKSGATVAEVAHSVGYANISYFNKLFKEEYGCTPKSFRAAVPPS